MPKVSTQLLAYFGEFQAKRYLIKKGYRIVNTNWRLKSGELDIVAIENQELVFVEVKTRKAGLNDAFPAADAVDYRKMRKLEIISDYYIERNQTLIKNMKIQSIRHDVIGVTAYSPIRYEIEHRIDAW